MKKIWFNNGIIEKCVNEDIILEGFVRGRLPKPKKIDSLKLRISKEDLFKYYIIDNHSFLETVDNFNILPAGMLNKLLKVYEIHKDPKMAAKNNKYKRSHEEYVRLGLKSAETQKKSWSLKPVDDKIAWSKLRHDYMINRSEDEKSCLITKMILTNQNKSLEEKDLINKKRSESCKIAWLNPELIEKSNNIKKINRLNNKPNICRSNEELFIYDNLIKLYPDLQYDVKVDDSYPYYVDFYIPSKNLFIEYQGHPSHGRIPYNENDVEAMNEAYKLYGGWLNTYTHRDVEKYNVAKSNNINLIRIYPSVSFDRNCYINEYKNVEIIKQIFELIPIMK